MKTTPTSEVFCDVSQTEWQTGKSYADLLETVVKPGYCIGCGVCAGVCPVNKLAMIENEYGEYEPSCSEGCDRNCGLCASVCPFFRNEDNESTLAARQFGGESGVTEDPILGYVTGAYVGYNTDTAARQSSPSGGLAHLVLQELLRRGEVDAVLAPRPIDGRPWFRMHVHEDEASVAQSRGSVYHVMPWDEVVRTVVEGGERRYAVIGLPCVIKALRLAQQRMPKLQRRIPYALGLTCGTVKTLVFPDTLARFAGTTADRLLYRGKHGNRPANHFDLVVEGGGSSRRLPFQKAYGFLWVNGYAQPKACLFCDDIFAEVAEMCFMDAWLREYTIDPRGISLVICRTRRGQQLLTELSDMGKLSVEPIAFDRVARSQSGVIHRKRNELAARLAAAARHYEHVPEKRPPLLPAADATAIRREGDRLTACFEVREFGARFVSAGHTTDRLPGALRAWWHCVQLALLLRHRKVPLYSKAVLLFLHWLPLFKRQRTALRRRVQLLLGKV